MVKRIIKAIAMVGAMFLGTVIVIKLVAEAVARFVLWTARLWGMGYK